MTAGTVGTVGLIVAAGVGQRLGDGTPKGFVALAGEPLLVHSVRTFQRCDVIDSVTLVVGAAYLDRAATELDRAGLEVAALATGGPSRRESVRRGLQACPPGTGVVAVHDAARPLVTTDLVSRAVRALTDPWTAVAPGLPLVDTVKLVDEEAETVIRTVDRRTLWGVQTPQVFPMDLLRRLHDDEEAPAGSSVAAPVTDDLELVEQAGGRVRMIKGERRNFKITYPEDLTVAEALVRR